MPEPVTVLSGTAGLISVTAYLARRYFVLAKEIFDIVVGAVLFVLCLPLMIGCALLIRLSSKGPVIFTQQRLGKDGRAFTMYKFRTMYTDAESASGATWAEKDDPRVVPVCRWMRKSHMDELPQLWNVIRGEMSLVGPRPERPEIMDELAKVYPDVHARLAVRPGITGLAQVRNGYDTSVDAFREKLKSDLEYIKLQSWRQELRILAATFGKLNDSGAH